MRRTIWPNEREHRTQHANQTTQPLIAPSSTITERKEDLARIAPVTQHPKRDEQGKEAQDMQDEHHSFEQRQLRGEECVEGDGEGQDGPDDQRPFPWLRDV
jgi:antitoxin (DNA-binding transcriptional repressor) of toxin-antitoxin stability system